MKRKKVKEETIKDGLPKKRSDDKAKNEIIKKSSEDKNSRWDKVIGINGKIVRVRQDDHDKFIEMGLLINKNQARKLCVAIDGDYLYHYYELIK